MEIMLQIVNHLSGIISFAWAVLLAMNMYSNHKNKKSNKAPVINFAGVFVCGSKGIGVALLANRYR